MRCPRCGNENPEDNRFCGMCGTTLLAPAPLPAKPQVVSVPASPAEVLERPPLREPIRKAPSAVAPDESPSISGPSFLGLNDPPPSRTTPGRRASISIDPDKAPAASNLHYLLEDEEDHGGGSGLWKFVLILIALALAVGFGYLRWKQQGFAWLNPSARKPAITEQAPGSTDSNSAGPATTSPTSAPATSQSAPSTTPSITPEPQPAVTANAAPGNANTNQGSSTPTGTAPPANTSAPTDSSKPADTGAAATPPEKAASAATTNPAPDKAAPDSPKANSDANGAADTPAPPKPKAEPPPKPRPVIPSDPVAEARKYLYGKGASQDCDRGMRLLKPAANSGNAKAMVEMGALYSAGLCTPHDLPTAYRWFALALRKEPDNQSIQTDLTKLWGEMTQPERQLAMKLTQ